MDSSTSSKRKVELEDDDLKLLKKAVPSQYTSEIYESLKKDKRLDRFLQALSICALKNMKLRQACEYLSRLFPGYVRGKGLNPATLSKMILRYKDVADAWGFTTDTALLVAFNRASKLSEASEKIDEIILFHKTYDKNGLFIRDEKDKGNNQLVINNGNGTPMNVETINTQDLILKSLQAKEDREKSKDVENNESTS